MGITPEQQYTRIYGPLASGEYSVGNRVSTTQGKGEIVWIYRSQQGLTYVIVDGSSWPFEVQASSIIAE
jgi:hypothetical protein